jgi:Do/DeqQ family serine protease
MRRVLLALFCVLFLVQSACAQSEDLRRTPVVRAVQAVGPAVVNITSSRLVQSVPTPFGGQFSGPLFERFLRDFGLEVPAQKAQSLGSGVLIDGRRGFVLTNAHVIEGASEIAVRLQDGRELAAKVRGADPDLDLAVLQVDPAGGLPQAEMGDSSTLFIGETVIAIGNPYGYTNTVTTGVVSAVGRSVGTDEEVLTDLIQTDAAINPGNSGGPLLNLLGQVIGINTAIQADAQGIGFAIPVNKAKRVLDELINVGHVTPVWLGLFGQDLDQPTAGYLGLKSPRGVLVTELSRNGPAERAGVRPGDAVLALGGKPVEDRQHLISLVRDLGRSETRLTVARGGRELTLAVTPQALDQATLEGLLLTHWGLSLDPRPRRAGLAVSKVQGPAQRLGLKPGDLLMQIGGQDISGPDDLARAFARYHLHNALVLTIQRGQNIYRARMPI